MQANHVTMEPFSLRSRFPNRRRALQACVACRTRKTRCDAAEPKCGYCTVHNLDCVYRDAQQPRIDYNTEVLLERIQLLEERLIGNNAAQTAPPSASPARPTQQPQEDAERARGDMAMDDVQIPLWHTANADHVYTWPIIRQLLSKVPSAAELLTVDATDVFFKEPTKACLEPPSESWRLGTPHRPDINRDLINVYFAEVTVFFPLLSSDDIHRIHDAVMQEGYDPNLEGSAGSVSAAEYALLLLVLCLASFIASGENRISITGRPSSEISGADHIQLWRKAKLLLGSISAEMSLVAAQCTMLAR